PGAEFWRLGTDEAFLESALDNALFDLLDGDRRLVNAKHACCLARSGTNPSRKLRKIVGRMQLSHRFFPMTAVDEIIPVRNEIVDRTPGMAERHAAIHAARALGSQFFFRKILVDLEPVIHPFCYWTPGRG